MSILAYVIDKKSTVVRIDLALTANAREVLQEAAWVHVSNPSESEQQIISSILKIETFSRQEIELIEVMGPSYQSEDEGSDNYHMTVTVLDQKRDSQFIGSSALTFILKPHCLVTWHHTEIPSLYALGGHIVRTNDSNALSPPVLLTNILDIIINDIAAALDSTGDELDQLLRKLFQNPVKTTKKRKHIPVNYYNHIIEKIGKSENLISKNCESLKSLNRMVIYYMQQLNKLPYTDKKEHKHRLIHISRELASLGEYVGFLSQRNSFLLDATLGMISVEQNIIIKLFTVASAVFMPPTLIASIYGMNFKFMPELDWIFGYPIALLIIVASALMPYFLFKKKGWL